MQTRITWVQESILTSCVPLSASKYFIVSMRTQDSDIISFSGANLRKVDREELGLCEDVSGIVSAVVVDNFCFKARPFVILFCRNNTLLWDCSTKRTFEEIQTHS